MQRHMQCRALHPPPAAELPTYPAKSSHLKGLDLELLARTAAELLHV